jgi:hypothetical protein
MSTKAQRAAILAPLLADPSLAHAALEEAYIRNDLRVVRFVEGLTSARSGMRERRAYELRNGPVPSRTCERCGNTYRAYRSDSRYCSTRCRVAAHRAKVTAAPPFDDGAVTEPTADPMVNPDYRRGLITADEAIAGLRVTADPIPRPDDYAAAYQCVECGAEVSEDDAENGPERCTNVVTVGRPSPTTRRTARTAARSVTSFPPRSRTLPAPSADRGNSWPV